MAQLNSTAVLPLYVQFEAIKLFWKNLVNDDKITFYSCFVLTDYLTNLLRSLSFLFYHIGIQKVMTCSIIDDIIIIMTCEQ